MIKQLRALLWSSVSSEEQAKEGKASLESQLNDLRALAVRSNWIVIDEIVIDGFSRRYYTYAEFTEAAAKEGFHAAGRMFAHWQQRDFDVIAIRDLSRVGREQSILAEFVARTIDCGAYIHSLNEGVIDVSNRRMYSAMSGNTAATEIDNIIRRYKVGMDKRLETGKPVASRDTFTHRKVRNHAGKSTGYAVREDHRAACEFIAKCILAGDSYFVTAGKFSDAGYRTDTGRSMWDGDMREIMLNPITWGNVARHNKNKRGIWCFDSSEPLPDGVMINYGTHEPMFTGELGEQLKQELRRREKLNNGRAWPSRLTAFSGLLVCSYCGQRMGYQTVPTRTYIWRAYCCSTGYTNPNRKERGYCTAVKKSIKWDDVKAWFDVRLRRAVAAYDLAEVIGAEETVNLERDASKLQARLDALRGKALRLLEDRAETPLSMRSTMQALIERTAAEIATVETEIAQITRRRGLHTRTEVDSQRALEQIKALSLDVFWAQPEVVINQTLFALMGDRKLAVEDGEITGVVLPSP